MGGRAGERAGAASAVRRRNVLLADNDGHRAAVLGIGRFGRAEFGRTFLAIADDVDAARDDGGASESRELLRAVAVAGFAMMNIMLLSVSVWSGAKIGREHVCTTVTN